MAERRIPAAWVERILQSPERIELDKSDPALRHALGRIIEQDDRILRVVYNELWTLGVLLPLISTEVREASYENAL